MEFNEEEEREKWQLTDEEFEANANEIFSQLALCAKESPSPTFIMVGGQAGSGKSALVAREYENIEGNAIIIDQDELRTKFPQEKYRQIHDTYTEREEFLILKPYISKLIIALKDRAKEGGYNIILESALRSVNSFIDMCKELKQSGYHTKLSILAVPEVEANLSLLTRYCYYLERDGECRRNARVDSTSVQKMRGNIEKLDELGIFDDIVVSIRGKNIDTLPEQIYSKSENSQIKPLQAYDEGRKKSFQYTKRNFYVRYAKIKDTLAKYNETDKLASLEKIAESFEELVK